MHSWLELRFQTLILFTFVPQICDRTTTGHVSFSHFFVHFLFLLFQVLYHMFEAYSEMGPSNIMYTDILKGFASFLVVAVGGTIIGVVWGFLTGLVTRYTNEVRVIEPIFIFVMAYLAYLNAEIFHMSGILS